LTNIDRAVKCLTAAQSVITREPLPRDWAALQVFFGKACFAWGCEIGCRDAGFGSKIKSSRKHLESALEIFTIETDPLNNLEASCILAEVVCCLDLNGEAIAVIRDAISPLDNAQAFV
jgi:hypothetical protein